MPVGCSLAHSPHVCFAVATAGVEVLKQDRLLADLAKKRQEQLAALQSMQTHDMQPHDMQPHDMQPHDRQCGTLLAGRGQADISWCGALVCALG